MHVVMAHICHNASLFGYNLLGCGEIALILHIAWDSSWDSKQNMHYEMAIFGGSRDFLYIRSIGTQFLRI